MATKRMLIDAAHPEEIRVAIMNENILEELDLELFGKGAYENSLGLRTRIQSEVRSNLINEIRTKNQGQPLAKPEDQYFTDMQTTEE